MKQQLIRRNFLKKGLIATAGMLFMKNHVKGNTDAFDTVSGSTNTSGPVNETINTIKNLHTTHGNFSDKEIPDEEIELIRESCLRAANSSNMQTYSIVVVKDRALIKSTCGYQGSCMMLFCVDYNRLIASAESLGLTYYPDNITNFITASINTSIAAQTATIAAQSLGIDALLTNGIHRGNIDRHWQNLNLPEKYCIPLIALVLGYADREPDHKVGRLTGKGVFHETKYQKPSKDELSEIIAKYDNPSLHLGLNENWKADGHQHYLEWLFKEWLKRDAQPTASETPLFIQLKKRGFVELQGK